MAVLRWSYSLTSKLHNKWLFLTVCQADLHSYLFRQEPHLNPSWRIGLWRNISNHTYHGQIINLYQTIWQSNERLARNFSSLLQRVECFMFSTSSIRDLFSFFAFRICLIAVILGDKNLLNVLIHYLFEALVLEQSLVSGLISCIISTFIENLKSKY